MSQLDWNGNSNGKSNGNSNGKLSESNSENDTFNQGTILPPKENGLV